MYLLCRFLLLVLLGECLSHGSLERLEGPFELVSRRVLDFVLVGRTPCPHLLYFLLFLLVTKILFVLKKMIPEETLCSIGQDEEVHLC